MRPRRRNAGARVTRARVTRTPPGPGILRFGTSTSDSDSESTAKSLQQLRYDVPLQRPPPWPGRSSTPGGRPAPRTRRRPGRGGGGRARDPGRGRRRISSVTQAQATRKSDTASEAVGLGGRTLRLAASGPGHPGPGRGWTRMAAATRHALSESLRSCPECHGESAVTA
jgi:hypothetical protein